MSGRTNWSGRPDFVFRTDEWDRAAGLDFGRTNGTGRPDFVFRTDIEQGGRTLISGRTNMPGRPDSISGGQMGSGRPDVEFPGG